MGDSEYLFAVAAVRTRERMLLTDEEVRRMAAMKDEKEVLRFLTEKGWGGKETGSDADGMLAAEEEKNQRLFQEMKVDPAIREVLFYPKLYHNLKAGIKQCQTNTKARGIFYTLPGHPAEKLMKILQDKAFHALPGNMRRSAEKAYEVLLKTGDGQRCDVIVDRACLEDMQEAARKTGNRMLIDYAEICTVSADIQIAVRAVRTGKDRAFLDEALAETGRLPRQSLLEAAARGKEALLDWLDEHGFQEAKEALAQSMHAFACWSDNLIMKILLPEKYHSVSAGPVIAYYLAKENEIRMARIVLTAKANGFSEEEIRERIRKMYG